MALAAVLLALGGMFKKAYAGTKDVNDAVVEIFNYDLTLEYLEAEFYATAVSMGTALVPAGAPTMAIQTIANHEAAHVAFLKTAIMGAGGVGMVRLKLYSSTTSYSLLLPRYLKIQACVRSRAGLLKL